MKILVIVEHTNNEIKNNNLSVIEFAKIFNIDFDILLLSNNLNTAKKIINYGAKNVYVITNEVFKNYNSENYVEYILKFVKNFNYDFIVASNSTISKDYFPSLAVLLDGGILTDVCGVQNDDGKIIYKKILYSGTIEGFFEIKSNIKLLTIRSTSFNVPRETEKKSNIVEISYNLQINNKKEFIELIENKLNKTDLSNAKIIICGGKGLNSKEQFYNLLTPLSEKLNAAIGATRVAVDMGFATNDLQIGQTGKIVAPEIYFGIGLSGSVQHLAGIKDSKIIISVNIDEEAVIFENSDYGIIGNAFEIIPKLLELLK